MVNEWESLEKKEKESLDKHKVLVGTYHSSRDRKDK